MSERVRGEVFPAFFPRKNNRKFLETCLKSPLTVASQLRHLYKAPPLVLSELEIEGLLGTSWRHAPGDDSLTSLQRARKGGQTTLLPG